MQNENTEKDISPFLDQDTIRHNIVHATYRLVLGKFGLVWFRAIFAGPEIGQSSP